ncbi:cilia- and flagella-associated protein 53-like [Palaemon carinicauda]|uniref:cilia- and flagella-associated protein 53-like n=1 Tax=Palaemon carinicauda TaxID=392227 RepID=UPI0035B59061
MADGQTDWLAVGARRTRAQRLLEAVTAKEEERMRELLRRRSRLKALLHHEEANYRQELQEKYWELEKDRLERRVKAAEELQAREEDERMKFVLRADEQRRKQQCHYYRDAYSREIQKYLNESRPQEITLRNQMTKAYGVQKKMSAVQDD